VELKTWKSADVNSIWENRKGQNNFGFRIREIKAVELKGFAVSVPDVHVITSTTTTTTTNTTNTTTTSTAAAAVLGLFCLTG